MKPKRYYLCYENVKKFTSLEGMWLDQVVGKLNMGKPVIVSWNGVHPHIWKLKPCGDNTFCAYCMDDK